MYVKGPIDVHAHFVPLEWNDWRDEIGDAAWPYFEYDEQNVATLVNGDKRTLRIPPAAWTAEARLAAMDRTGIGVQALSPVPSLFGYDRDAGIARAFARRQNECVAAQVARHPDRFVGMAAVPLQDVDLAIDEMHDAAKRLGLRAVEIGTVIAGRELDDERLEPFFQACCEQDVAVFIHPGDAKVGRDRLNRYYLPNVVGNPLETALAASRLLLSGMLERYPALRICFSHCGGALPSVIGRVTHAWTTRADTRERSTVLPVTAAKGLYFDSITHDAALLRYVVDTLGFENVVLGTDFPFAALGEPDPLGFLERSGLSADIRTRIANENGARFLGLT